MNDDSLSETHKASCILDFGNETSSPVWAVPHNNESVPRQNNRNTHN